MRVARRERVARRAEQRTNTRILSAQQPEDACNLHRKSENKKRRVYLFYYTAVAKHDGKVSSTGSLTLLAPTLSLLRTTTTALVLYINGKVSFLGQAWMGLLLGDKEGKRAQIRKTLFPSMLMQAQAGWLVWLVGGAARASLVQSIARRTAHTLCVCCNLQLLSEGLEKRDSARDANRAAHHPCQPHPSSESARSQIASWYLMRNASIAPIFLKDKRRMSEEAARSLHADAR